MIDIIGRHWGRADCSDLNIKVEKSHYSLSYFNFISNLSTSIIAATTASPYPQMSGNLVIVSIATTAWPCITTLKGHCIYFKDKAYTDTHTHTILTHTHCTCILIINVFSSTMQDTKNSQSKWTSDVSWASFRGLC